jgi:hypothetical protein
MATIEKRIAELETLADTETDTETGGDKSFAELLGQARKRVGRGEPVPETRITRQMLDDPPEGEFHRQMHEARERVRNLRLLKTTGP